MQTAISTNTHKKLGAQIATYGPRKRHWREAWIWPFPGFILSVVLLITGIDWYYYGYTQYGPVAAASWSQNWFFWGVLTGVLTMGFTLWQIFRSRILVNIYRYGIDVKLPGRSKDILRWEDISGIASEIIQEQFLRHTYHTSHHIKLTLAHGKPIILDDRINNLPEMATRIKANLYPRLLPGLRMRFQTGHVIPFGPIEIQSRYIGITSKRFPWDQISRITVISGHLIVDLNTLSTNHDKGFRVPVYQIPNLELLLQILDQKSTGPL